MLLSFATTFVAFLLIAPEIGQCKAIRKRQSGLNDLINAAIGLVRPLVDSGQQIMADTIMIPKSQGASSSSISSSMSNRDSAILGAPRYSSLADVPMCRGNSRICKFISCTAQNFKNDQSLANLNLAAQVIGDRNLRQAVSSDPDALKTVCFEQGMSYSQCKVFTQGFRLVDDFITRIEDESRPATRSPSRQEVVRSDPFRDLIESPINTNSTRPRAFGSTTWSTMNSMLPADVNSFTDLLNLRPLTKLPFVSSVLPLDNIFKNTMEEPVAERKIPRNRQHDATLRMADEPADEQTESKSLQHEATLRIADFNKDFDEVPQRMKRSDYYDTVSREVQSDPVSRRRNVSSTNAGRPATIRQEMKQNCMQLLG